MAIDQNGRVTTGTRQNLIRGLRSKPMRETAVDAILAQVGAFVDQLSDVYSADIAAAEVGVGGSARASEDPILGDQPPAILLYGRVQSGKTAAMSLTAAMCLDNGFRIVIVLTANNLALVEQTANRFKAVDGPRVFSTVTEDVYEWEGQEADIAQDISTDGLILVCAKDSFHLPRVIQFLQQIDAPSYPALVFDDEADAATPDTTLAARSSGRPTAPPHPSTIHRRIVENLVPGQQGESINEVLPHSLYVQVTATPFILFLQRDTSRLRPKETFLLQPGENYCGGELFFGGFDAVATVPDPPVVLVPDQEGQRLARRAMPPGLAASLNFFLVSAAARSVATQWPDNGFCHLSHPSVNTALQGTVAGHIERHLNALRRDLRDDPAKVERDLRVAHDELLRTVPGAPVLAQLLPILREALRQAEVSRVNYRTEAPHYGPRLNFLVGGNILGRGLTIDELLVTYYVREAGTSQMDTVWQHARMYGYRHEAMPYTRVYLPRRVALRFKEIHEAEQELRALLGRIQAGDDVPIRVANRSRATRPNATESSQLRVYGSGLDQIMPRFLKRDQVAAAAISRVLLDNGVPIADTERNARTTQVPLEVFEDLLLTVPLENDDPGRWDPGAIAGIVDSYANQYGGVGSVYVRGLQDGPPASGWVRGRLSGPEIQIIRSASNGAPALALLYLGDAAAPDGWYPTLVMPSNSPTYVISPT